MPDCFRDCVLIPIQKGNNDATLSQNYRPIVLASSLSKVLERLILNKYESIFCSDSLQFGFKHINHSTSLCTASVKTVVSHYMRNGSAVLGCLLDASKAFDRVDHGVLFQKPFDRGLPLPVLKFLVSWYGSQQMRVRWGDSLSDPFNVSNGVRQGSILSPLLLNVTIYEKMGQLTEILIFQDGCNGSSSAKIWFCRNYTRGILTLGGVKQAYFQL